MTRGPSRATIVAGALAGALLLMSLTTTLRVEPPRVRLTFSDSGADEKEAIERQYGLVDPVRVDDQERGARWSYRLVDAATETVAALRSDGRVTLDPATADDVAADIALVLHAPPWSEVSQRQSVFVLAAGVALLALATIPGAGARRRGAVIVTSAAVAMTFQAPLTQPVRMGDFNTYTASRENFETYLASESGVRFEAHVTALIVRSIDRALGSTREAPLQAFRLLGQLAALWFGAMLLAAGYAGEWSPATLRYMALVVAAPATLMYFGFREIGYLSLNAAVFPLVAAGLRRRTHAFEAGCALGGLGAALHGFGVLALAGTAFAAMASRLRVRDRLARVGTAFAVGTSLYLVWIFLYVVAMNMSILPGHAGQVPWRPLFTSTLAEYRVNDALFSALGAREALAVAWLAGIPLVTMAVGSRTQSRFALAPALAYAMPSALFVFAFWPVQGVAVEADLVFAAFPGVYALMWAASRSASMSLAALGVLASAHVVFWRVMLSDVLVNSRVY